ncbi:hypothetical protein tb265_45310 [Gemmatimonadetes bacterium T265]|nr:hypothetical protein tb265_45310 [Gemmatimonadetes bacterium T265]
MDPRMDRRTFVRTAAGAAGWLATGAPSRAPGAGHAIGKAALARPSLAQLAWQEDELALFVHFGPNTFTDREWGDGREAPAVFAPARLDARQWARAARAAGACAMVLTAKHHDGFCLWPSATTTHTVAHSPWRGGAGDVVREFVDACRAEGLRPGLYCSPWDRHHPAYGDSPRYNAVYVAQLAELLTRYGPLAEVWFDGANGEGPTGRRQVYDWPRVFATVRRLQPGAVIFSDAGPDVRWCGNERGEVGAPNWAAVDPAAVPAPGASGPAVDAMLRHGDPFGAVWRPAEVDVSIRPGWFYHPAEDARVRAVDDLMALYLGSVGRNAKLLLNVPPTRDGVFHPTDVARLAGLGARRAALDAAEIRGARATWRPTGPRTAELLVALPAATPVGMVRLAEDVARAGQRVARFALYGHDGAGWRPLARGTTVGVARLVPLAPAPPLRRVRLVVEDAVGPPARVTVRLYAPSAASG